MLPTNDTWSLALCLGNETCPRACSRHRAIARLVRPLLCLQRALPPTSSSRDKEPVQRSRRATFCCWTCWLAFAIDPNNPAVLERAVEGSVSRTRRQFWPRGSPPQFPKLFGNNLLSPSPTTALRIGRSSVRRNFRDASCNCTAIAMLMKLVGVSVESNGSSCQLRRSCRRVFRPGRGLVVAANRRGGQYTRPSRSCLYSPPQLQPAIDLHTKCAGP